MPDSLSSPAAAAAAAAPPSPSSSSPWVSFWTRFWHEPVRAERLALMRIFLGVALLTDLLFQYLPNLMDFFGPTGVAPRGLHDEYQMRSWRWTKPRRDRTILRPVGRRSTPCAANRAITLLRMAPRTSMGQTAS